MPNLSELVLAIVGGESQRFSEVVHQFDTQVRQFITRRVPSASVAEDLVQETFYLAFKNLDRLQRPEQLGGWLIQIARNCVTDHFRKLIRRQQNEAEYGQQLTVHASEDPNGNASWIWQEVEALPANFKIVLTLRYQQQLSYDEIASELGLSESTVRGRIHEARKSLKKGLTSRGLFP